MDFEVDNTGLPDFELEIPEDAEKFVIGNSIIRLTENDVLVSQADRVIRDWLSYQIFYSPFYTTSKEFIDDGKSGKFKVELLGKINDAGVIRPRFYLKSDEFIQWEKRFLPSVNVGLLFVTTSKGIIDYRQAKKEGLGGALFGYIY